MNIYREEQTGYGQFSIPLYNLSLSTCIPNMNFLCYITVGETSLTKKKVERKKKRTNTGKNNRRRPILNPTIELVSHCQHVYQI